MQVMTVFMPILWDLFPIWIIYVLHHDNYSKQAKYNKEERETLIRIASEVSTHSR
jgi:hypothetical protein